MKLKGSVNSEEVKDIQAFLFNLVQNGKIGNGNFLGVILDFNFDLRVSKDTILSMIGTLQDIIDQGGKD